MLRALVVMSVGLMAAGLVACDDTACVVGETTSCVCANGNSGLRTCRADKTLSACSCATDVPDTVIAPDMSVADGDCVPSCTARVCGDDGCGGSCGTCSGSDECTYGVCTNCSDVTTCCDFRYQSPTPGLKSFGAGCTEDQECVFNVCLKPGAGGNVTNTVFGFCTRGCNCNEDTASQLTDTEKLTLECANPPGNQGGWRHVILQCETLADCREADPRWTDCRVQSDFGTLKKICIAE
jgi:hypothetical protein